jgi:hypothetical protein
MEHADFRGSEQAVCMLLRGVGRRPTHLRR